MGGRAGGREGGGWERGWRVGESLFPSRSESENMYVTYKTSFGLPNWKVAWLGQMW